jgi:serine/threonine protein kinase
MLAETLGPYRILGKLGEGGMGEVYRAHDTKLKRDVALKVLPDSFASDPDRLARFTREAQTLASLNHPNIAHIHGLEESGGVTAIVMELVEGDDLSQRIARGAMPLDEALPIATQIAVALEAAHEQGIIHRDLKPANIKVRPDGTVKVLDFGLAKAPVPEGAGATADAMNSPTITTPAMTQAGMMLGTAAYMAPEQAKGKAVDKRADIWAFGVVLFEMLTGQRAFDGEDITEVLGAVVRLEPNFDALPADVPARVRRVLQLCLRKDLRQRAQAMGDVRLALEGAFETAAPQAANAAGGQWQVSTAGGIVPRWRRDGKELYYLNPAGAMMAAPITVTGSTVAPGAPVALFPTRIYAGGADAAQGRQYDVTRDGRFLINTVLDAASAPITLLMNWHPEAKK